MCGYCFLEGAALRRGLSLLPASVAPSPSSRLGVHNGQGLPDSILCLLPVSEAVYLNWDFLDSQSLRVGRGPGGKRSQPLSLFTAGRTTKQSDGGQRSHNWQGCSRRERSKPNCPFCPYISGNLISWDTCLGVEKLGLIPGCVHRSPGTESVALIGRIGP